LYYSSTHYSLSVFCYFFLSDPATTEIYTLSLHDALPILTAADTGANGTLNFNRYANGQMTVTVPAGWRVHIDFVNSGAGALPHSQEVIREVTPLPSQGIAPAIPNATTRDLIPGIPPLEKDD